MESRSAVLLNMCVCRLPQNSDQQFHDATAKSQTGASSAEYGSINRLIILNNSYYPLTASTRKKAFLDASYIETEPSRCPLTLCCSRHHLLCAVLINLK